MFTQINPGQLDEEASHRLLKSCVAPRPIAWVSSVSSGGVPNLAPFSCYTFVATLPPMICLSIAPKGTGKKDTLVNIEDTGEFVVNVATQPWAKEVTATAADLSSDRSEWDLVSIHPAPSSIVRPARIAECEVAMECRLHKTIALGESNHTLIIAEVLLFHIRQSLLKNGEVDVVAMKPLGRLSGDLFAGLGEIIEVKRT